MELSHELPSARYGIQDLNSASEITKTLPIINQKITLIHNFYVSSLEQSTTLSLPINHIYQEIQFCKKSNQNQFIQIKTWIPPHYLSNTELE